MEATLEKNNVLEEYIKNPLFEDYYDLIKYHAENPWRASYCPECGKKIDWCDL